MSQTNIERVQVALERFAATGEPAWDALDEQVEVYDHDILDAGVYRGHAGFKRWLEDWAAAWAKFSMELEEFRESGDRVLAFVRQRATGKGSGVELERQDGMVFELRDEKIVRVDYYNNRDQALEAIGLER
jgi:ketosteroid isomerase-like protein